MQQIKIMSSLLYILISLCLGIILFTPIGESMSTQTNSDSNTFSEIISLKDSFDVCSLLSKSEVEKIIGKKVLDPKDEKMANLYTCTYADPEFPTVSKLVTLSVFISVKQRDAKEVWETAKSNAASVEVINNLGDYAYWDEILSTLWFVKEKYEISIDVGSDEGGLDSAKKLAAKVIERLP